MFFKKKATGNTKQRNKPRKTAGASRRRSRKKTVGNFLSGFKNTVGRVLRITAAFVIVGGVIYVFNVLKIDEKWNSFYQKPITNIQIDGEFLYLNYDQVSLYVENALNDNFLNISLMQLKANLEQNPWVDSVSVARKWPGTLHIHVIEQQPIARWGNNGFLNMRGDIIAMEGAMALDSLPVLSGEDQYATEVMQNYLRMGKLLAQAELTLAAVKLDKTRSWTLMLDDGVTLKLGRDYIWEKLQHLTAAKRTVLKQRFKEVRGIDMRYHNGMAISWSDDQPMPAIAKQ